jgi:hypothetical protein
VPGGALVLGFGFQTASRDAAGNSALHRKLRVTASAFRRQRHHAEYKSAYAVVHRLQSLRRELKQENENGYG